MRERPVCESPEAEWQCLNPNQPLYVVLLLVHAGAALIGFGSIGLGGFYATRLDSVDPEESRRFFLAKRTVARVMVVVAGVLGLLLLALNSNRSAFLGYLWLRIAVADYLVLLTFVIFGVWPLERRIRESLTEGQAAYANAVRNLAALMVRRSVVVDVLASFALLLMVTQPGR